MQTPTRLGSYEISRLIGKGGMGEVYLAHDTKLGRDVALKFLPPEFASDPERMARFEREARVLAALNHPNIAQIYGLEESAGNRFLVLELVDGETLADRLRRGALPLEEALAIAGQIAEGVEAAHEKGVTHRDLKPANIKISSEGKVKVLDFGLAKMWGSETSSSVSPDSPTLLSGSPTQPNVILGTAAYMSPEQVRGKAADERSDVWSFGCVLYELLTGKSTFAGDSMVEILGSVLKSEPDFKALPPTTPEGVRRVLRRCLQKDRRLRLHDLADARIEIEEERSGGPPTEKDTPSSTARVRRVLPWAIAAAALTALAALGSIHFRESVPAAAGAVRFTFSLPDRVDFSTNGGVVAVSPDGSRVMYVASGNDGERRIYVRSLDSLDSTAIAGTEGVSGVPFWSRDSKMIAFGDGTRLRKISVSGGPPQVVCASPGLVGGGYWTEDNRIVFGTTSNAAFGIAIAPAGGGDRTALTRMDPSRHEVFHGHPFPLPDGKHFLYVRSSTGDEGGIYVGSIDAKPEQQESARLLADQASPVYVTPSQRRFGLLLFRRDGTLLAQPFDPETLRLNGDPVPLAEGIVSIGRFGVFSVSETGALAYRTGAPSTTQLAWFDRQGKPLGAAGTGRLFEQVALSPDGTQATATIRADQANPTSADIWVIDLARSNALTRLTFSPNYDGFSVWSPDGNRIAYASGGSGLTGSRDLHVKASNGTGNDEIMLNLDKTDSQIVANHWSRDGWVLYSAFDPKTKNDLWALPMTGNERKPISVAQTDFNETQGQFSPEGKWVAYVSDESGRPEVYVQPFPPGSQGARWMVSNGGGNTPRWRGDGKELFYLSTDNKVMAADVFAGTVFKAGVPKSLFPVPSLAGLTPVARWDVAPDGQRFLIVTNAQGEPASTLIHMVLNWPALLKR